MTENDQFLIEFVDSKIFIEISTPIDQNFYFRLHEINRKSPQNIKNLNFVIFRLKLVENGQGPPKIKGGKGKSRHWLFKEV